MRSGSTYTCINCSSWIISLILSIIPVCNWWLGIIERLHRSNLVGAVLFFFFGWLLGFLDFLTILLTNSIYIFA